MNERNLNEDQWEERKQWSLGVRQRRKMFWLQISVMVIFVPLDPKRRHISKSSIGYVLSTATTIVSYAHCSRYLARLSARKRKPTYSACGVHPIHKAGIKTAYTKRIFALSITLDAKRCSINLATQSKVTWRKNPRMVRHFRFLFNCNILKI